MEGSVLVGLDGENILGIAQVLLEIRRYRTQVIEHAGKRQPIGGQDGIFRVHDVKPDGSVVHVDDDLHGVADVVQSVIGRAASMPSASGAWPLSVIAPPGPCSKAVADRVIRSGFAYGK